MLAESRQQYHGTLDGFSHINRYWDRKFNVYAAKILPGEYYVTRSEEIIVTVLGSCISACVRDKEAGIGGMNHFMLPEIHQEDSSWSNQATRYGSFAMEHLINDILKFGGKRSRLEIKITGGGRMFQSNNDIGKKNIEFVKHFLETDGFDVLAEDLGGIYPRKVRYCPITGVLKIKKLNSMHNDTIFKREDKYSHEIIDKPVSGEVELF